MILDESDPVRWVHCDSETVSFFRLCLRTKNAAVKKRAWSDKQRASESAKQAAVMAADVYGEIREEERRVVVVVNCGVKQG